MPPRAFQCGLVNLEFIAVVGIDGADLGIDASHKTINSGNLLHKEGKVLRPCELFKVCKSIFTIQFDGCVMRDCIELFVVIGCRGGREWYIRALLHN